MTNVIFPVGGVSFVGGTIASPVIGKHIDGSCSIVVRNHLPGVFEASKNDLDFGTRHCYDPILDFCVSLNESNPSNAVPHAIDYWICTQIVAPSRAFIKFWYQEDGNGTGILKFSPHDNSASTYKINVGVLNDAMNVWERLNSHRMVSPISHLLRAYQWLGRSFMIQDNDLLHRALLLAIALEATLSPDSYSERLNRRKADGKSITSRFAMRLNAISKRFKLPKPPMELNYEVSASQVYSLRSTLVHSDSLSTDWRHYSGCDLNTIDSAGREIIKWLADAVRISWKSALLDIDYVENIMQTPAASDYWEKSE